MAIYVYYAMLFYVLISVNLVVADHELNSDGGQNRRTVSDTVSNLFSEVGDLFLDIDRAITVQTAPKVEYQDSLASLLRPLQPRKEYFDRIQENYKTLQERLGSILEEAISPKRGSTDPVRKILAPLGNLRTKEKLSKVETLNSQPHHENKKVSQNRELVESTDDQMRKSVERLLSDTRRTNKFISSLGSKVLDEAESVLVRRSGDTAESANSDAQGRIIGDSLYSESSFDNYIRDLLKNHGKWMLDNPLLQRWRSSGSSKINAVEVTSESLPEVTEDVTSTSVTKVEELSTETLESSTTDSPKELPKSEDFFEKKSLKEIPVMASDYYRVDNDGKEIEEDVEIVIQPESEETEVEIEDEMEGTENYIEEEIELEQEPQEIIILAFTPDGVPLKLRIGPEIEDPIEYLHNVLRTAGVTLKIPVESHEVIEPVGNEVLLLGVGSGIITRTVPLDVSNPNELNALLRVLKKAKSSQKRKY